MEYEDRMSQSVIEGRTALRSAYRTLASSGYRNTLSELLRSKYNPLRGQAEVTNG